MDKRKLVKSLLVSSILLTSLTGCGDNEPTTDEQDASSSDVDNDITVDSSDQNDTVNLNTQDENDVVKFDDVTVDYIGEELTESQKNSIALLNYLAVLAQEVNSSKNSRVYLEETYASLINNTNPDKIDEITQSHLSSLLDIIENYRMITVKRDRLQYIYDQNKAKALKEAMPNPISMLSVATALDIRKLAASAIYMAVDSYSSYEAYKSDMLLEHMQEGWALDDEESQNLHESTKRAFTFMIEIVREENLPGNLSLNENSVAEFVKWKNNTNVYQRIRFLESQQDTYYAFGYYWLELANSYYEYGDYEKCLESIYKYEKIQTDIFRKDYYFAKAIPNVIASAIEVYDEDDYVEVADKYLDILLKNTELRDWSLRYFAAEIYLDLYAKTENAKYINKAYEITLDNVNYLIAEQKEMNKAYLNDVVEAEVPKNASKDEKKQIKDYNKALKQERKTQLPPVYEPLVLNCDLLFSLAEEMKISTVDKSDIEGMLRANEELFVSNVLENKYTFDNFTIQVEAEFEKNSIFIPVIALNENSKIVVKCTTNDKTTNYDDWVIKEVSRKEETPDTFIAKFNSKNIKQQEWNADSTVEVLIYSDSNLETADIILQFKVAKYNDAWLTGDFVEFEQVN